MPLGADPDTAVHKAVTSDGTAYFVGLRRGAFDEIVCGTGSEAERERSLRYLTANFKPGARSSGPMP